MTLQAFLEGELAARREADLYRRRRVSESPAGAEIVIDGRRLLNFASNIVALAVFLFSGKILWLAGLLMGAGQIAGAWLGSHLAIRHGSGLIRPLLVVVSVLMSAKLLLE